LAERPRRHWRAAAEAAIAAVAASIAVAAVAFIAAAEDMAEAMASMALPSSWVRAAGGTPTANASAGGDVGSIVVTSAAIKAKVQARRATGALFF